MTVAVEGAAGSAGVPSGGTGPPIRLGGRFRLDERVTAADGLSLWKASLWKATDELLRRPVTVHLLPRGVPVPAHVVEAVQAAARVNDPRLATVYDTDYSIEGPYIVSEWTPGTHLEDLVLSGLPSPALAAAMIADAADALAVAHEAGRPHLCLGPRSLRWDTGSGLKITGLGIDAALSGTDRRTTRPRPTPWPWPGCSTPCSPASGRATRPPRYRPRPGTRGGCTRRGRSGPGCPASWTRSRATRCSFSRRAPRGRCSRRPGWPWRCARCSGLRTPRSARRSRRAALRSWPRTPGPGGVPGTRRTRGAGSRHRTTLVRPAA